MFIVIENIENALNEKVCPNFWPVLYMLHFNGNLFSYRLVTDKQKTTHIHPLMKCVERFISPLTFLSGVSNVHFWQNMQWKYLSLFLSVHLRTFISRP